MLCHLQSAALLWDLGGCRELLSCIMRLGGWEGSGI